ncbi:hypothetical protein ILUMI_20687 [Ignelater luminosus]|uniref:Reverse transcriptase domain-containing protein n=1 Tax=Ignelater luminosus TaxID=2038154 RepID=A0A8K0G4C1_IGNLU|nr:hypothetical protein ILUMI_20687 [Ignelater luminosus]
MVRGCGRTIRISTWIVKSLYKPGKMHNGFQEMQRLNMDVLGISDVKCLDSGQFSTARGDKKQKRRQKDKRQEVTKEEAECVLKTLKNGKAPGLYKLPSEILKLIKEDQFHILADLFKIIYETGTIPSEWLISTFITLPKKTNIKNCPDIRIISLMGHALKTKSSNRRIISDFYFGQKAVMRVKQKTTEEIEIKRGVRHGCVLFPALFNLYSEDIMNKVLHGQAYGIKINGIPINNLRCADDTVLIAEILQDLQILMNKVVDVSQKRGLSLNKNETKFMLVTKSSKNTAKTALFEAYSERRKISNTPAYHAEKNNGKKINRNKKTLLAEKSARLI